MKKGIIILIALLIIPGCAPGGNEIKTADPEKLKIGETVYVCGCPMMCCNTISRAPGGRCACNVPLKKGSVSGIRDGMVYVKADDGREKRFMIKDR